MKYILFACYIDWDKEKSKFVSPSIFLQWNANYLLFSMAWYPILLTIHLVNKYLTEPEIIDTNNSAKFISYVIGWAENILAMMVLTMGIWLQKRAKIFNEMLNQLLEYDAPRTQIYRENRQIPPIIKDCEILVLIISVLCILVPFSFVSVLTLDSDETHNLIKEWLEIDLKWEWRHAPFLILMAWGASNASSIIFFGTMMPLLYFTHLIVNLNCMIPSAVTIDRDNQDHPTGYVKHLVRTKEFGIMTETKYMHMLRLEGIMNRIFGQIDESVLATSHHVYCLAIFVVSSFIFIKAYDMLFDGGTLVLIIFIGGVTVPLLIEYQESTRLGQVCEASMMNLKKAKQYSRKGSGFDKFIESCKVLRLNLAYPFYNIDKYTFLEFLDQAADCIFNLLAA